MKKAMKVLGILLCAVLLVVGSVAATLAYLTTKSNTVTNTFSVGNVSLSLVETALDENGDPQVKDGEVVRNGNGNNYKLIPGNTYIKDPTVIVGEGSEESYVRMMVTIKGATWNDIKDYIYYLDGEDATNGVNPDWTLKSATGTANADGSYTYEFRYKETVAGATDGNELSALFDKITIGNDITQEALNTIKSIEEIIVEAHAIQADGFETNADGAWAALDEAYANA